MRSQRLWKSVAGVTCAAALVLGAGGVAGAAAVAPTHARTSASESPTPDCHSAEHAFLGAVINCQNEHRGQSSGQ